LNFKNYSMTIDLSKIIKKEKIQKKAREMTIRELSDEIDKYDAQQIPATPLLVEIWKKMNMSAAPMALIIFGIPLGIRAHRSEKSIGFGISLLLFTLYWGMFLGGIALALQGLVPPALGVSLPNMLFFTAGVLLFWRTAKL
jgi:lipopolysaccharide export system permease protein